MDFRYNYFSMKSVDTIAAFVVGIAGVDLLRQSPLEIDLRHNKLSKKAIERLCGKIRMTPRSEVKLVQLDDNGETILLYGVNKCLLRIDCRNNTGKDSKPSLKERLHLGSNITNDLEVAFPGDDIAARNPAYFEGTIYPRDEILKSVSYED